MIEYACVRSTKTSFFEERAVLHNGREGQTHFSALEEKHLIAYKKIGGSVVKGQKEVQSLWSLGRSQSVLDRVCLVVGGRDHINESTLPILFALCIFLALDSS